MRDFGGVFSRAVFGFVVGMAMATSAVWAQEDETVAPAESVVIEIIGDSGDAGDGSAVVSTETQQDTDTKAVDQQLPSELAPADLQQAATRSLGTEIDTTGIEELETSVEVDPFVGSFSTAVPIDVPAFHGISPNLALTYNSSRGNGFVGLSWELAGLSAIERASSGKGAPRYNASDIFLLDGQELIPCQAGTVSPGCDAGGTHTTKTESYRKILHDATANTWTIWSADGTVLTLAAKVGHNLTASTTTYRWVQTAVTDTHGNRVDYTWWCDGANDCYPEQASYNGVTVAFHRVARPDAIVRGNGHGLLRTAYRLAVVEIGVGTEVLRAYALNYAGSESTAQSRLTGVTQYGTDAVVDPATGTVTGGTALPASTFGWPAEANGTFVTASVAGACSYRLGMADFDGDGTDDVLCAGYGNSYGIAFSNGDGTYAGVATWSARWCTSSNARTRTYLYADFNGDGRDDVQCTLTTSRTDRDGETVTRTTRYHALSNGDGTLALVLTADATCNDGSGRGVYQESIGDFNGDGKADRFCRVPDSRERNNGDSYTVIQGIVGFSRGDGGFNRAYLGDLCTGSVDVQVGDFDGDGLSDLYCTDNRGKVFLSNGNGTFRLVYALKFCSERQRGVADFNGDGRDDLYCQANAPWSGAPNGNISIATSIGNGGFAQTTSGASVCGPHSLLSEWRVTPIDLNGDGRSDMLCRRGFQNVVSLHTGSGGFSARPQWNWCGSTSSTDAIRTAEIDGDGKRDFYCLYNNSLSTAVSSGSQPSLLASVTGPLGGTTTVDYTPSSAWANAFLPMTVQTVSAITTDDGRGNTSTTSYSYEGGLWNQSERRFLGFRKATTTLPCIAGETVCPYTESTFRQDLASAGRVEQVDRFDGAGTLLTRTLEEYVVNDTIAPYTALNTASESQIIVGAVTRRTRVTRSFDDYANVVEETGHGNADILGDEITVATDYAPDTTDYIVSLPARMRSFEGTDTTGTLLTESQVHYDGATAWMTPPVRGDPTESREWLDTEARFVSAQAEYDIYGNVTATIDPLLRRSEIDYDTTYNLYPIAARNPLYFEPTNDTRHQTSTVWDTVCGVPTSSTDLNGNATTTIYDALCRPTRTDLPDGGFAITSYNALGDPTAQYVETQTPPADGSGNIWSRVYMDGFGRPYRSTAKGPAVGQEILADTAYNLRGGVASQTAPYYAGDPVFTTTLDYDALNRPTGATHPDGNWTETAYGVEGVFLSITSTDELGHPVTLHLDAFGRAVHRQEPLETPSGTVTVDTGYVWDRLGRLTSIIDDVDNQWVYTPDSLGRIVDAYDPDLGFWTKTYDDSGQQITQTDALGQVTRFTHDALGRVLTRTARDGTPQAELTTYTYDETVAGFHNTGLPTRMENAAGILRYRYDEMGREVQRIYTVDGSDHTFTNGFDDAGRLIWQEYPDGDTVGSDLVPIAYDAAGRMVTIPGVVDYTTYDASGNRATVALSNGVATAYDHSDQRGWLEFLQTTSGMTTIQSLTYGRDEAGQINWVSSPRPDESWTYGYDALRRLVTATNTDTAAYNRTYSYDTVGNMTSNSGVGDYSYPLPGSPRPHAVTSVGTGPGAWTYVYDANGNMTTGAGRTFTYNGENRPTQIDTQTYVYGPDGERWKTVDTALGIETLYLGNDYEITSGVITKYLPGDAKRVSMQGTGGSNPPPADPPPSDPPADPPPDPCLYDPWLPQCSESFSMGLSMGAVAATSAATTSNLVDPPAETFWLHRDHQGSLQAITDATGAEVQRFRYYPYGDRLNTATVHDESKGWIGERQDSTGLFYLHARYYDPVIGRFVTPDWLDPMDPRVGPNRYAYSLNNPVMYVDPGGNAVIAIPIYVALKEVAIWTALTLGIVGTGALVVETWPEDVETRSYNTAADADEDTLPPDGDPTQPGGNGAQADGDGRLQPGDEGYLPDDAMVCRGGRCEEENFVSGSGVTVNDDGTLEDVSTQSRPGATLEELAKQFPNGQVGVTTAGEIRAAGGDIKADGTEDNPNHATVRGITGQQAEELFTPTADNPVPSADRWRPGRRR